MSYKVAGHFLHYTASALKALAIVSDISYSSSIKGIVDYLKNRDSIEQSIQTVDQENIKKDEKNVIKIGEVLHALM